MSEELGITCMMGNAISKTKQSRKVLVFIVNITNKTFRIKKGCAIGQLDIVDKKKTIDETSSKKQTDKTSIKEHRKLIKNFVKQNKELFVQSDVKIGKRICQYKNRYR